MKTIQTGKSKHNVTALLNKDNNCQLKRETQGKIYQSKRATKQDTGEERNQ